MTGSPSTGRSQWHRLIEHYTPDGMLGRLLLGTMTGSAAGTSFVFALFGIGLTGFVPFLLGLLFGGVGAVLTVVTLVTLWPVYLSLIGNIESPSSYGRTAGSSSYSMADAGREGADEDDPAALLKRQYAAGEISHAEFERRLNAIVEADEREQRRDEKDSAETEYLTESGG